MSLYQPGTPPSHPTLSLQAPLSSSLTTTGSVAACSGCASRQEACVGKRAGLGFMVPPPQACHLSSSVLCCVLPPIKSCVENCTVLSWLWHRVHWGVDGVAGTSPQFCIPRSFCLPTGCVLSQGQVWGLEQGGRKPLMPAGSQGQMFPLSHVGDAPGQSVPRIRRGSPWELHAQSSP